MVPLVSYSLLSSILRASSFFPGIVYNLTYWYRREELALRIGLFFVASSVSGMIGGLLAYGILSINGSNGLGPFSSWQLLFLFEGTRGRAPGLGQGQGQGCGRGRTGGLSVVLGPGRRP